MYCLYKMGNKESNMSQTKTLESNSSTTPATNSNNPKVNSSPLSSGINALSQTKSADKAPQSVPQLPQLAVAKIKGKISLTSQIKSFQSVITEKDSLPTPSNAGPANEGPANLVKSTQSVRTGSQPLTPTAPTTVALVGKENYSNLISSPVISNQSFKIKVAPVLPLNVGDQDTMYTDLSIDERKILKAKKSLIRRYSTGLTFIRRANVKRITCDQLNPLDTHKDRFTVNRERRNWVLRKLYCIGGWIRKEGKSKEERSYVAPNTPLPSSLLRSNNTIANEWNYFDDVI